jgi:hypothetical protein
MFELSALVAPWVAAAAPSPATAPAATATASAAAAAAGCTGLEALNPLCYAVHAVSGLGGSVAAAGVDAVLGGLSNWVAGGAEWLLAQIGNVLNSTTTIDLGASWFAKHYAVMTALAAVVVLPLLVVSTLQALYRQNAGQLIRAFFVQLPLALLLGVVAVQIVILCLSATDAMCTQIAGGSGSDISAVLGGMTNGLTAATANPAVATFVLLLVALLVAVASLVLWLELLVRAAAVYVAVLFLPLALATLVWPAVSHWCRRLVETLAALILSKFVIVATLSLAASALASGTAGTGDAGSGFVSVLAGGALLVLSTFVPFSLLRLIPMVEAGAVGHLEGVRQRSTAALTRVPRSAAQFALREGMLAHGAAKLATRAGPPGMGGPGGTGAEDGKFPSSEPGTAADCNDANGGLIPGQDGMMIGLPIDVGALLAERYDGPPKPRGRKPILEMPARGGSDGGGAAAADDDVPHAPGAGAGSRADGALPPGLQMIGKPGPYDRRYALGHDGVGPVLHGLPPLYPRPGREAPGSTPSGAGAPPGDDE